MKVLQISSRESRGGAAKAAFRLHDGLRRRGVDSSLLVRTPDVQAPWTLTLADAVSSCYSTLDGRVDRLRQRFGRRIGIPLDDARKSFRLLETDVLRDTDIVHLHHLYGGAFSLEILPDLAAQKPLVWTLHDMSALTGHCAYPYDCLRWQTGCHTCPMFMGEMRAYSEPPPTRFDRTKQVWRRKRQLYSRSKLHIVTPSRWLQRCVEQSILADSASVQCIPYGLDLEMFRPVDRHSAKAALGIPPHMQTILFAAEDTAKKRKGFEYLLAALERLPENQKLVLITVGNRRVLSDALSRFDRRDLGVLESEDVMRLAYNAADLFVFPTLADNFPVVLIESLACGTPAICFDVGGVSELVVPGKTGELIPPRDTEALADCISRMLDDQVGLERMREACRATAEKEFGLLMQADRYVTLYQQALHRR